MSNVVDALFPVFLVSPDRKRLLSSCEVYSGVWAVKHRKDRATRDNSIVLALEPCTIRRPRTWHARKGQTCRARRPSVGPRATPRDCPWMDGLWRPHASRRGRPKQWTDQSGRWSDRSWPNHVPWRIDGLRAKDHLRRGGPAVHVRH